jgi:hypothetical protein
MADLTSLLDDAGAAAPRLICFVSSGDGAAL